MDTSILGFMAPRELLQISEWAKMVPADGVIVEVGSYLGLSASAWAEADSSVKVYCIDKFDDLAGFIKNTSNYPNVIPLRGDSPNNVDYPGDLIDIFFLDASHTNPSDLEYIEYFLPLIKPGGLFCGHDYGDSRYPDIMTNIKLLEDMLGQKVTHHPRTSLYSFRI